MKPTTLTKTQKATFTEFLKRQAPIIDSKEKVVSIAFEAMETLQKMFPGCYPVNNDEWKGTALSLTMRYAMEYSELTVMDALKIIAECKEDGYNNNSDFGAFADLTEILYRVSLVKNLYFIRPGMLHVKAAFHADIVSKKYGNIECGTNGKTWSEATFFDYMNGNFQTVIYGVFNDTDKENIFALVKNGEIEKAIEYVCNYSGIWSNKYEYLNTMQSLSRGKGITVKGGKVQCQFNDGKYDAFINGIENGVIPCLADELKK